MKLETMSKNIVDVMLTLSKNEMLGRLLIHDVSTPYDLSRPMPVQSDLINPKDDNSKIQPFPFDEDGVTDESGSFIRIYYNNGDFNDNETIAESTILIDIICSKDLWLINNDPKFRYNPDYKPENPIPPTDIKSIIRPYDIAGRVVDLVGKRSIGKTVKLKFNGYQHLYINKKFHCVRLYAEYMSVESKK